MRQPKIKWMVNFALIRRRREKLKLSFAKAAKRAGMSSAQWYNIETGRSGKGMRTSSLIRIAQALRIEPGQMFTMNTNGESLPQAPPVSDRPPPSSACTQSDTPHQEMETTMPQAHAESCIPDCPHPIENQFEES